MRIVLDLPAEVEARLRNRATRPDPEALRQWLAETLAPAVAALLQESSEQLSDAEFELVADELAAQLGPDVPSLSEYVVRRAGIYEDHA
jgi:Ser/Thr protein kinase RdoA (MazF antagonist)